MPFSTLFVSKLCCCKLCHNPNTYFLVVFEYQIGSPSCCGFSEVKLKVPNQFDFSVLQDCSPLPPLLVPNHILPNQSCSFAHAIANIIKLCCSLINIQHLLKLCILRPDVPQFQSVQNKLCIFHDLVSTICSSISIIADVLHGWSF